MISIRTGEKEVRVFGYCEEGKPSSDEKVRYDIYTMPSDHPMMVVKLKSSATIEDCDTCEVLDTKPVTLLYILDKGEHLYWRTVEYQTQSKDEINKILKNLKKAECVIIRL